MVTNSRGPQWPFAARGMQGLSPLIIQRLLYDIGNALYDMRRRCSSNPAVGCDPSDVEIATSTMSSIGGFGSLRRAPPGSPRQSGAKCVFPQAKWAHFCPPGKVGHATKVAPGKVGQNVQSPRQSGAECPIPQAKWDTFSRTQVKWGRFRNSPRQSRINSK